MALNKESWLEEMETVGLIANQSPIYFLSDHDYNFQLKLELTKQLEEDGLVLMGFRPPEIGLGIWIKVLDISEIIKTRLSRSTR